MSTKSPNGPTEDELARFVIALHKAAVEESSRPKPPLVCVKLEEAGRILHDYGLDEVLTAQDDPVLWAMALIKHWPRDETGFQWLRVPFCYWFALGKRIDAQGRLQLVESWELERVGTGGFRATEWDLSRQLPEPWRSLQISRPSKDEPEAVVASGQMLGPLCGNGAAHIWLRQSDGTWTESEPPTSSWIS